MDTNTTLPDWRSLKNEVGVEFNQFCIIRGKQYITLGDDIWVGYWTLLDGSGGLTIGSKVSISSGVHIYTHDSSFFRKDDLQKDIENGTHIQRMPVKIGSNVQIGANSVVLMGTEVGDNVIIGAGSVVKGKIPSNCIAVGNPCKVIKTYDSSN